MSLDDRRTAVLFPGQGSQSTESRRLVADRCPELLERCATLVGDDAFARCGESTRFAQPAIFCASIAAFTDSQPEDFLALAGHSLGDVTALAAAGVLAAEDALELVVLRGRLMAEAASTGPAGAMLALLKADPEQAGTLAFEHGVHVANDNAPGQIVLSGERERLLAVAGAAREQNMRTILLDVAGAFHSPAMSVAVAPFHDAATRMRLQAPKVPAFSSITAAPFVDVPTELAWGLTRPVRWRETMQALHAFGATRFADAGPGAVMAGLAKRNLDGRADALTLEELDRVIA